jgi:hypothetical protein
MKSGLSQVSTYELSGVIKIDQSAVLYKLSITDSAGKLRGVSFSDVGKPSETHARVLGFKKGKNIFLRETKVIYSKADVKEFCLMQVEATMKKMKGIDMYIGAIKGINNQTKASCATGTIQLIPKDKTNYIVNTMFDKIEKMKLDSAQKAFVRNLKIKTSQYRDSVKVLRSNDTMRVYIHSDEIGLEVWDEGIIDSDEVAISMTHNTTYDHIVGLKKVQTLTFFLKNRGEYLMNISSVNDGSAPPNTTRFIIKDQGIKIPFKAELSKGKSTYIIFIKDYE